jgi:hypothetical protein
MGWFLWMHAQGSTQPPIFDVIGYYVKAHAVWSQIHNGHLMNPLNIEPTYRPPGTILMSYPLGFSWDFRGMYFRSVFLPIVLIFIAVLLVLRSARLAPSSSTGVVLTAAFLTTASLFFHFELADDQPLTVSIWGFVDGFLTGLAALSGAFGVLSVQRRSVALGALSSLVGVLMMFVKPSGMLLAFLADLTVTIGWLYVILREWKDRPSRLILLRRGAVLASIQILISGGALLAALRSNYLGARNMSYGNAVIEVMRAELKIDLASLPPLIQSGMGIFIPVWLLGVILCWVLVRAKATSSPSKAGRAEEMQLVLGSIVLIVGVWFWILGSGGATQIRYFIPFFYLALMWALGPLFRASYEVPLIATRLLQLIMVLGIVNISLLVALPHPSRQWQFASGVDVTSGTQSPALGQANWILANAPPGQETIGVYSLLIGVGDAMFQSQFSIRQVQNPHPRFLMRRAIDWLRPSAFRLKEIVSADYILFDPSFPEAGAPGPEIANVSTFAEEEWVFGRWAKTLNPDDGVELISAEKGSTLLKVVDRARLRASLERLLGKHQWRQVFLEQNLAGSK